MKFIFLVFISQIALAAPKAKPEVVEKPVPAGLRLVEILKMGLEYSPTLKKSDAAVRESEATLGKTRATIFPTIDAKATAFNRQNAVSQTFGGNNGDTYTAALTLSQPLYVGGAFTSGVSYYKSAAESARQSYFATKQQTVLDLLNAFYDLSRAQQKMQIGLQNRDILKSYMDITKHYENIGRTRKMDKLRASANLSLSLADVESISQEQKKAQAQLKKLLGVEDPNLQVAHVIVINPVENISLEQAYKAARENNPDIRIKKIALEQVEYSRDIDLAADFPSLYLSGSYGYQAPDRTTLFTSNSNTYNIGLTLTVPIFSGLSSFSKRNIYAEKTYQAEHDLRATEIALKESVENSLNSLKATRVQLQLAQSAVKEAQGALDLANSGYKQGTASSLDVVNLQEMRYRADGFWINIQYTYLTALANLRQLMGIDLEKAYGK